MLDIAIAYNQYKFIGNEFLTWLWFSIEKNQNIFQNLDRNLSALEIGNRIVLENQHQGTMERITIKGDDANLEEGILALKKGALVTELNLIYRAAENDWQFTIKGESLNVSNLKTPKTASSELKKDTESAIIEKFFLFEAVLQLLDKLFGYFIKLRISDNWQKKELPRIKKWIFSS